MSTRILGILLAALAILGVLNFVQAMRGRFGTDAASHDKKHATVEHRSDMQESNGVYLDRTFPVSEGQMLYVKVQHADIDIITGESDQARITVTVSATSDGRAREVFDHMNFEAYQDGDRVVLRSQPRDNWDWNGRFSIDVRAEIPRRFDLDLTSTHGDVEVESIDGSVELRTTHGDVEVEQISGPGIRLESTHGDVLADELETEDLQIKTTHGDISIGAITTERYHVVTTHSDIDVEQIAGSGELETTHGDVSARIRENGGTRIRTTHGDVSLWLPAGIAASVNLRAEHVKLASEFSFDGSRDTEQAKGVLNGGGPELVVSTTYGEVIVRAD